MLGQPSPVPRVAGVYVWYFREVPGPIELSDCHVFDRMPMLYVGIAPKRPYQDGRRSKATLHQRVRYHSQGNAEGFHPTTDPRLFAQRGVGIVLRRVGSGRRRTFSAGEHALSDCLEGNVWTLSRTEPDFAPLDFSQRCVGTFSDDGGAIEGAWEINHDGTTWEKDFDLNYRKR